MAINFVKNDDIRILRDIEQYYSTQIDEMPMNGKYLVFLFLLKNKKQNKNKNNKKKKTNRCSGNVG